MYSETIPGPDPFIIEDTDQPETPEPVQTPQGPYLNPEQHFQFQRRHSAAFLPHNSPVETPAISIPELLNASLFLPIPATDPFATLLAKYVPNPSQRPTRDTTGEWQNVDFHALVITNSWRALARLARDRIVHAQPRDINLVLGLWYLRLSCLARMRLYNQTTAECNNLFAVLFGVEPPETREYLMDHILPFELEVLYTRRRYWASDPYGYLDEVSALLTKCQRKSLESTDTAVMDTWKERSLRLRLIIASQLIEMKDIVAATDLLIPLSSSSSPELQSSVGHLYLQAGHLQYASACFQSVAANPDAPESLKGLNAALQAMALGDWTAASNILGKLHEHNPEDAVVGNNLAISYLNAGHLRMGIDVLENVLRSSPSTVLASEPYLFNLATLYELRSATALENKVNLLVETAKWCGDGLKTSVLKLG